MDASVELVYEDEDGCEVPDLPTLHDHDGDGGRGRAYVHGFSLHGCAAALSHPASAINRQPEKL